MKKCRGLLLSAALVFELCVPCFADQVQGLIESVDSSGNSIVVKDPVSGTGKTIRVHPKVAAEIRRGSVVKATLKPGSDEADTIEVLAARTA